MNCNHKIYGALLLSSSLLNIAFFYPYYAGWLVFIFLVPLIICIHNSWIPTAKQGFIWGASFFSIHWIAIADILIHRALGTPLIKLFSFCFIVLYMALYAMIWFWLTQISSFRFQCRIIPFLCLAFCYFYLIYYHAFFIFGFNTGYSLGMLPLPLMAYEGGRTMFVILRFSGATAIILAVNGVLAYLIQVKRWVSITLFSMVCGCFLFCYHTHYESKENRLLSCLAHIKTPLHNHPRDILQEILISIGDITCQNSEKKIIVMAETAYPFEFNERAH